MTSLSEVLQSQIRISQGKTEELRYGVLVSEGYCYGWKIEGENEKFIVVYKRNFCNYWLNTEEAVVIS